MTIYLQHIEGSKKGQTDSFGSQRIRIGRQPDNDLRFDPEKDREVSGRHAEITCQDDGVTIKDFQSRNGTFVNGRRISDPTPLADGDIIQFAPHGPKVVFSRRHPSTETAPVTRVREEVAAPEERRAAAVTSMRVPIALMGAALVVLAGLVYAAWSSSWTLFVVLLIAVVLGAVGLLVWWWLRWRRSTAPPAPTPVEEAPAGPEERVEGDALQGLRRKWAEGLATLRKSKIAQRGADPTYAVPWILTLGETGSGKTETIRAASPISWLSSSGPRQPISATRNCDWWFFDNVVLLDTAGRYTFPVTEQADGGEWRELLSLLKRSRPNQPIDGAVVAVPVDALCSRPVEKLQEEASQIRKRLDEMARHLGTMFPIYLLITKLDRLSGFAEFFGGLPTAVRGQAMGAANDDPSSRDGATAFLDRGFRAISDKLDRVRLARLDEEENAGALRSLFLFPEEFRSLRGPLRVYAGALFRQVPYQETPFLRGLFFASTRQGEVPLSRLSEALGFSSRGAEPAPAAGTFFARDLFSVILSQGRSLVGRTALWQQRYQHLQAAALVVTVAFVLLVAGILTLSFFRNSRALSRLDLEACLQVPAPSGSGVLAPRLRGLDRCRETIEDFAPRSFWGRAASNFGLGQASKLEEPLRQRFVQSFKRGILDPLDARIDQKLGAGQEAPVYVGALLKRINLLARCRSKEGCPHADESVRPSYRVMLAAESPNVKDDDPRVAQLAMTDEAYLRWQSDPRSLEEMQGKQIQRVMRWLQSGGLRAEWILASASSQFPPVRSRDFWGVDAPVQVDPPYTQRAWTDGIQPLLSGLKEITSEAKEVRDPLAKFETDYRTEVLRQWERFLNSFPQGERLAGGRGAGRELAGRILSSDSPYKRLIDAASANLTPFIGATPQERDAPSWAVTLQRYAALKSKTPEGQKGAQKKPEDAKAKSGDEDRELVGYLTGYLEALDQLRGDLSTPEKAFKAAQKAFEEGEPSDKAAYFLQKAIWNRDQLRRAIGSRQGEDRAFWVLVSRPIELAWRVILDQAGLYLQEQWEALRLELTDLPPGPKAGKVLAFVNGQVAPFLDRRRDPYTARTLLNDGLSLAAPFLQYVSRSRSATPEELGKLDPPRQIVASL